METLKYFLLSGLCFLLLLFLAGGEPWPEDDEGNNKDSTKEDDDSGEEPAYYKTCANGYVGKDCQTATNKCEQDKPCLNEGTCVNGVNNYSCICTEGFGGNDCENANKCRYSVACNQVSDPPQTCYTCRNGFIKDPEDNTSCKYANQTYLIVAEELGQGIRLLSLKGGKIRKIASQSEVSVQETEDKVAYMDYSFRTNTLFWNGQQIDSISADKINVGSGGNKFQNYKKMVEIKWLAVDWIYNHLYFVAGRKLVVSNFNGTMKKVLINDFKGIEISIDPLKARMYWTSPDVQRIEADLDGSSIHAFISPNSTDDLSSVIPDFSEYQSNDAITGQQFEKYIYRTDSKRKTIYKINKCDENDTTAIYKCDCGRITRIMVFNSARQPEGENVCIKQNSQCSHFCFPVRSPDHGSVSTKCACPEELSLSADKHTCV